LAYKGLRSRAVFCRSGETAAAVKQPQRPIMSWLCARTVKETLRSHILLTTWCSQCVRYTRTRHLLSQHVFDHTIAEIWMLPDVYIITDELGQEEWWNVHLTYCAINGEFFTVRLTFAQLSAM
jgi:hypothetical protein